MSELLTLDEVAGRLRVSRRTVERLVAKGWLRVVHPSPGRTCIEEREVEAYQAWLRRAA